MRDGCHRRRMLGSVFLLVACLFSTPASRGAADEAASLAAGAERAYRTGLFDLAQGSYVKLLGTGNDGQVLLRLLEIAVRRGDWEAAQQWSQREDLPSSAERDFWQAQLSLGQGNRARGIARMEAFLQRFGKHELALEASLTLAGLMLEDRDFEQAQGLLSRWSRSDNVKVDFLKARLAAETGQPLDAINRLERMRSNPQGLPLDWLTRVYFDLARMRLAEGQVDSVIVVMRSFLEQYPDSVHQDAALEMLSRAGAFASAQDRELWLTWSMKHSVTLQGAVLFQVAKAEAGAGNLAGALTRIEKLEPAHPLADEAAVVKGRWALSLGNVSASLNFLTVDRINAVAREPLRKKLVFLRGQALYLAGRAGEAQAAFEGILPIPETSPLAPAAAFNAAVASIAPGQDEAFAKNMQQLDAAAGEAVRREVKGEARFFRALSLAKDPLRQAEARQLLADFVTQYPRHLRISEAQLIRTELALAVQPPDLALADDLIALLKEREDTDPFVDRIAYLEIWRASLAQEYGKVAALGEAFPLEYPKSSLLPNVSLRRIEAHLKTESFGKAVGELNVLSASVPSGSRIAVHAGFLRADILQRTADHDKAVKEWRVLIGLTSGEEQLIARHQQALTLCQQGNRSDALAQWDEVIRSQPSHELLVRALTANGECLTLMAESDPNRGSEAIESFDRILALPNLASHWRQQTLYRKGMVYQRMNAVTEALTSFEQVVPEFHEQETAEGERQDSLSWYSRAGFERLSLLEARRQWEAAAQLADQLATVEGNRSDEARERARYIWLRHDPWSSRELP